MAIDQVTIGTPLSEFFERLGPAVDVFAFGEIPASCALEPACVIDAPPVHAAA